MRALVVGIIAATLAAAGCGQPVANPDPSPAPAPSAAPSPAQSPAPANPPAPVQNEPAFVDDCQPCRISISDAAGDYAFRFDVAPDGAGRVVRSIQVIPPGASTPSDTLPVKNMMPVMAGAKFFFGGLDVNFDGQRDLVIITSQGAANAYASYWLFDPGRKRFGRLGEYPVFTVDAAAQRLKTYERGGAGGMIFEATEYAFQDGALNIMRVETQEPIPNSTMFRRTVQERRGSDLVITLRETIKAPN